ncbi:hypothetical protein MKW92_048750 [Papaver armeniacum]|nr:hypothetical protein MKW92_048750 [Papaver armeniacum]
MVTSHSSTFTVRKEHKALKMAIIRRKDPPHQLFASCTVFALAVFLVLFTDMASAWLSVCSSGDDYIERNFHPLPKGSCSYCTDWCKSKCTSIDMFKILTECREVNPKTVDCQCCCTKVAPTGPPPPPTTTPFSPGDWGNICTAEQKYILIPREQAKDCPWNPQCETKCKEEGRSSVNSECWGGSINRDKPESKYVWYEECCCGDVLPPPPPPPSPSLPPPSPPPPPPPPPSPPAPGCGCGCGTDINIQISIKSGGNAEVSEY